MVSVIFYEMVNNICIGRQVRSASDNIDLSDKWKKIFHVKVFIESSVKGKDWKLSQAGLVPPIMLLMLLTRTAEPQSRAADKNKVDTGRQRAM